MLVCEESDILNIQIL